MTGFHTGEGWYILIDHPGCTGRILVNGIDCRIRKDIPFTSGIVQLSAYICPRLGTVIMVQHTLNINPLADRGICLQLQFFPQFCLAGKYQSHRAFGIQMCVKRKLISSSISRSIRWHSSQTQTGWLPSTALMISISSWSWRFASPRLYFGAKPICPNRIR